MSEEHPARPGNSNSKSTRFDGPHPPSTPPLVRSEDTRGELEHTVRNLSQVRTHATQLAGHLQASRDELAHREAEVNTRIAVTENDMRAARLWLQERSHELDQRVSDLEQREQQITQAESRLAEILGGEKSLDLAADKLDQRSQLIKQAIEDLRNQRVQQETELDRERQRIDQRREASLELVRQLLKGLERKRAAIEEESNRRQSASEDTVQSTLYEDHQQSTRQLEARLQYLENAEALLVNSQADLDVQRKQLQQYRERNETEIRQGRTELAQVQQKLDSKWQQRQAALTKRSEQLDAREATLTQTREDVAAVHRETLELRLATEELWSKLTEVMPAPALTVELGRIRRKLAETYCMERSAATEKIEQLEATESRLKDQYVKLMAEKKELRDWVARQHADVEQQAARLVAREQELARQDSENLITADQWQQERRRYEAEIRKLLTELRRGESPDNGQAVAAAGAAAGQGV